MTKSLPIKFQHELKGHEGAVRAVCFNSDGEYCMTCGSDKSLKLWNPYKAVPLKSYHGHGYEVLDCDSSTDNSKLVSCSADRTVVLWDVATGKIIRKYRGHLSRVNCVQFNHPESSVIFSGSYDSTVRCWDCRSRSMEPIQVIDDAKDSVTSLKITEQEILTGSVDGYVRLYDIRQGQLKEDCLGEPVTSVGFTNDQQCFLASTLDNSIRLIDKDSGSVLNTFTGHKNTEYKIDSSVLCRDTHVASGCEEGSIYFWDLIQANVVHELKSAHKGVVYSLSRHPTKDIILTAATDSVKLWTQDDEVMEELIS